MPKQQSKVVDEEMSEASLLEYFASVPDPRVARSQLYPLASVLALSLCAVICGANSFVGIACFATVPASVTASTSFDRGRSEAGCTRL
jgi:hypothetical protein